MSNISHTQIVATSKPCLPRLVREQVTPELVKKFTETNSEATKLLTEAGVEKMAKVAAKMRLEHDVTAKVALQRVAANAAAEA